MRVSLKWKFTLFLAGLLLFTVAVLSTLILQGVARYQREQMEDSLAQMVKTAQTRITGQYVTGTRIPPQTFMSVEGQKLAIELGATSGTRVLLYSMDGVVAGDSLPMAEKADVADALAFALQNKIAYLTEGDTLHYLAPLQGPDGQIAVIQFDSSLLAQNSFFQQLLRLFVYTGIGVLLISFLFGFFYMNRQAIAISRLKQETDRIRMGQYLTSPGLLRKDELGDLSAGIFEMNQAIKANIQTQKQFFDNISHEFKTPLTAIKANADLLHMYGDDPSLVRESSAAIASESSRLHELVETALQLSALEKYSLENRPEVIWIDQLLEELSVRLKGKAEKAGITLRKNLVPATIWADKDSLIHIFLNLMDNAIKYNKPHGEVIISNRIVAAHLEILIQDTGIGIPADERARIFEPFYTVNPDRARQTGGTGLGLALVQQFVEKQQGTIRVEDGPNGQGSTFIVTFRVYTPKSSNDCLQV
ncbi:sensor histidine kinase [Brevibacillus reuszeri]|uniref:sensor histidine kinase n=1 Tax=Brevibacillus reuszeri TaxID=54915 RepID=UPI003D20D248